MIRRIILTIAFLASLSLSARDVKSVSLPAADVTDAPHAPHAWTVPPLWSELQGRYRGCREKLIFLWSVKVGLFDPLAPIRQCSCRAYYQKKSRKSFDLQDSVAEREGFEPPVPCSTPVFKTGAFDHSAISPCKLWSSFRVCECKDTQCLAICQIFTIFFSQIAHCRELMCQCADI